MSSPYQLLHGLDYAQLEARIRAVSPAQALAALQRERLCPRDLALLVSPAAAEHLELLCARAAAITEQRFGRVMQLYVPLYLSNECTNRCAYCGFAADARIRRHSLQLDEVAANAQALHQEGFRHILLVTGEHPVRYGVEKLEEAVRAIAHLFDSISIEVYPMSAADYARLARAGVDGLALYQETYDPARYAQVHLAGRKTDYRWRLEATERGGEAGFRSLGLGSLLGLGPWRSEAVALALHAELLSKRFWRSRISLSFPRLVPAERSFRTEYLLSDQELIQLMAAMRLVLPDAEIVLSTREPAALRDRLLGTCVTRMSAGSKTSPGGYLAHDKGEQFQAQDLRSPAEVARVLAQRGFDPVWKDMDIGFRS